MPYVTRRQMLHGDRILDDGDVIEDFEDWPATNRRYLLEKGDVEFVEKTSRRSTATPAPTQEAEPSAVTGEAEPEVAAASGSARPRAKATAKKPTAKKPTARKTTAKAAGRRKGGATT